MRAGSTIGSGAPRMPPRHDVVERGEGDERMQPGQHGGRPHHETPYQHVRWPIAAQCRGCRQQHDDGRLDDERQREHDAAVCRQVHHRVGQARHDGADRGQLRRHQQPARRQRPPQPRDVALVGWRRWLVSHHHVDPSCRCCGAEVFDGAAQPILQFHLWLPTQQSTRAGDVGLAHSADRPRAAAWQRCPPGCPSAG